MKSSNIDKAETISREWRRATQTMVLIEKTPQPESRMVINGQFFVMTEVEAAEIMDRVLFDLKSEASLIGLELDE